MSAKRKAPDKTAECSKNILFLFAKQTESSRQIFSVSQIQIRQCEHYVVFACMQETRNQLLAEAEVYCKKKQADTDLIVNKMTMIRDLMSEYYRHNNNQLSSDDFCKIITECINKIG